MFFACTNKVVSYSKVVHNQSSHSIWYIKHYTDTPDTITIIANEQYFLEHGTTLGTPSRYAGCEDAPKSVSLVVKGNTSLKVTKDITNEDEWKFNLIEGSLFGSGECECRFTIKDKHIK